ncbi:hypothetical protein CN300_20910 [Bacillus thuringiensis]|nr:hypothetical protein CN300_20910 [Bacillus thuringiensis]
MLFIKENLHNLYTRIINARRRVAYQKKIPKTATGRPRLWFFYCFDFSLQSIIAVRVMTT